MSEDGAAAQAGHHHRAEAEPRNIQVHTIQNDASHEDAYPISPRGASTPNPFSRRQTGLDIDDYFVCLLVVIDTCLVLSLTAATVRPPRYFQAQQMATVHADAWQYPA